MLISGKTLAIVVVVLGTALFAQDAQLAPLPSELPVLQPVITTPVRRVTPVTPIQRRIGLPQFQGRTNALPAYQPRNVGDDILRWDASEKEFHAEPGETNAAMTFSVTNVSTTNVVINWVRPSCGCTAAKLPPTPWTLKPGEGGNMEFSIDLRGKHGLLSKYVSVDTSHGQKYLMLKIHIPQPALAAAVTNGMDARTRNMQLAMVDRQVVFKGDCAACHATPAMGKTKGEEIYAAACAICHDVPNRASMVPDLRATARATSEDYWKIWITHGKPGTLMPAFGKTYGGPLSEEQIKTLAAFLFEKFPRGVDFDAVATTNAPAATVGALPASGNTGPASAAAKLAE